MRKIVIGLLLILVSATSFAFESPFRVNWDTSPIKASSGKNVKTDILIGIPAGHFLYKDKTNLSFVSLSGVKVRAINYPKSVVRVDPLSGKNLDIYPEGEAVINVEFEISQSLEVGPKEVVGLLEFQGCKEKLCLRPEEHEIAWNIEVVSGGEGFAEPAKSEEKETALNELFESHNFKEIVERGRLIALVVSFLAGLLTSLTPCVWPLIPVTLLIIGVQKKGRVWDNFKLALFLVLGISITYAVIGIAATAFGQQIGFLFQKKVFLILVVLFFLAMSASMLGLFTIQLPTKVYDFFSKLGGNGYRGAFLCGVSLGFLATPCVGPILGPMIVWVAVQKTYLFGTALLVAYALGIGLFYIVIGTFYGALAGKVKNIKAGNVVKKVLGIALLIPALYYFNSIVPVTKYFSTNTWYETEEGALVDAVTKKRPMMIVFSARWCPPCQELENKLLTDPDVENALKDLVVLHIDSTIETSEVKRVLDKYNVVGWPTILFVSFDGTVYGDLTIVGDVPKKEKLMEYIEEVLKR